ncbi:MAG: sialidase family protein [Myxococcota bacterium]
MMPPGSLGPGRPAGLGGAVVALALTAVWLGPSGAALAHSRPSFATNISASGSKVAIQTTFGLLVGRWTDPTPGSWRWICPQAMGSIDIEDPATFYVDDETLLMPGFNGLTVGTNDACDWLPAAEDLENVPVFSGARSPVDERVAYALTSRPRSSNAVFTTGDGGLTWSPAGTELTGAARYDSVVVAPSDDLRLYVGGSSVSSNPSGMSTAFVFRSEDGGATWTTTSTSMRLGERAFRIRAVDPRDPNHVLASFGSAFSGRLVASTDGGRSFQDVIEVSSIDALQWRPDGDVVVLSGANETGIWRSRDGGLSFLRIREDLHALCLTYIGTELWACGGIDDETQVTRSFDDGETWSPVMVFETDLDVVVPCGADTTVGAICPAAVDELRDDFDLPPLDVGPEDPGPGEDAPDPGANDSGCSSSAPSSFVWLLLLGTFVQRRGWTLS